MALSDAAEFVTAHWPLHEVSGPLVCAVTGAVLTSDKMTELHAVYADGEGLGYDGWGNDTPPAVTENGKAAR